MSKSRSNQVAEGNPTNMEGNIDMHGKTVIVTGSTAGLGKETARALARLGARVIIACRNQSRGDATREDIVSDTSNENVVVKLLDLSSLQSVRDFANDFNANESRLDILINNAGVVATERTLTKDGFELMFGTNHLGHFLLTNLLLEKLKSSTPSRIVTLSSLVHKDNPIDFDDLQSEKFVQSKAYGRSKTANALFTVQLAKNLAGTGVTCYSVNPGIVRTELFREYPACLQTSCMMSIMGCCIQCFLCQPFKSIEEGARTSLYCSLNPSLKDSSGLYYSECKVAKSPTHATDEARAQRLWDESCKLVGL